MSVIAQQPLYTGVTAGVQLLNRPGALRLVVFTTAAAAGTVTIYDNTSATGNPILTLSAVANSSVYPDANGLPINVGLFVVVTGAGAQVTCYVE